jgi:hypothetical protein
MAACLCLGLVIGSRPALARLSLEEFYIDNDRRCKPSPVVLVTSDKAGDANIWKDPRVELPAILAILHYELSTGVWKDLEAGYRKPAVFLGSPGLGQRSGLPDSTQVQTAILEILNDPLLTIAYTGKQSLLAHTSGAQAVDSNNVIFNLEGLHAGGAPLSQYTIAQHIIHELGHVFQQRNWTYIHQATDIFGEKETLPRQLESQLSPAHFAPEEVARVAKYLKDSSSPAGRWSSNFGDVVLEIDPNTPFTGDNRVRVSGYWYQDNDQNRRGELYSGTYDPKTRRIIGGRYLLGNDQGYWWFQLSCGGQTMEGTCGAAWFATRVLSLGR